VNARSPRLQDYTIQGPCEVRPRGNTGSFRAVRRRDGLTVLLHRFRPAGILVDRQPVIELTEAVDFTRPFMTRFSQIIVAAGSAYLVEPLPPSVPLADVWRTVLHQHPDDAVRVAHSLVAQLRQIMSSPGFKSQPGHVCLENLVLAPGGTWGLLATLPRANETRMWIRRQGGYRSESLRRQLVGCCAESAIARVVENLMSMHVDIARTTGQPLLSDDQQRSIALLATGDPVTGSWYPADQSPGSRP
jgi:hypothetical protein